MHNIKINKFDELKKIKVIPLKSKKESENFLKLQESVPDLKEALDNNEISIYPYQKSTKNRPKAPATLKLGKNAKNETILVTHGVYWDNQPPLDIIQGYSNFGITVGYDPKNIGHIAIIDIDGYKKYPKKEEKRNGETILVEDTSKWYDEKIHRESCKLLYDILKTLDIDFIPIKTWSGGYHLWFKTKEEQITSDIEALQYLTYPSDWPIQELRGKPLSQKGTDHIEIFSKSKFKKAIIPPSQIKETREKETRKGTYTFLNKNNKVRNLELVENLEEKLIKVFTDNGFIYTPKKHKKNKIKRPKKNKTSTNRHVKRENLNNNTILELIDYSRKCYHPGHKHDWSMRLCGMLRRSGFTKEESKKIVTTLEPNDKPMLDRLERAYSRNLKGGVNGWYEFEKWTKICCEPESEFEDTINFFRKIFKTGMKNSKYDVQYDTKLKGYGDILADDDGVYFPFHSLEDKLYYLRLAHPNNKDFTYQWCIHKTYKNPENDLTENKFQPKGSLIRRKIPFTEEQITVDGQGKNINSILSNMSRVIGINTIEGGFKNFFICIKDFLIDYNGLEVLKTNPNDVVQEYNPANLIENRLQNGKNPNPKVLADYLFEKYRYKNEEGVDEEAFKVHYPTLQYYMLNTVNNRLEPIDENTIIQLINDNIGVNTINSELATHILSHITDEIDINYDLVEFEDGTLNTKTHEFFKGVFYNNVIPKVKVPCNWIEDLDVNSEPKNNVIWDALKNITYCTKEGFENNLQVLLAGMGHLFMGTNELQRAMLLIGPPKTGKSTILSILKYLFPYSEVKTHEINKPERFSFEPLIGACINIDDDMQNEVLKGIGQLNSYISGNGIMVEKKHETRRIFLDDKSTPRLVGSANTVPIVLGDGFKRRRFIVKCDNVISEENRDMNFINDIMSGKYKDEMSYIVHKSISEYWNLGGRDIISERQEEFMEKEWELKSYPLKVGIGELFSHNYESDLRRDVSFSQSFVYAVLRLWLKSKFDEGLLLGEQINPSNRQIKDALGKCGYSNDRLGVNLGRYKVFYPMCLSDYGHDFLMSVGILPSIQPWEDITDNTDEQKRFRVKRN